MFAEKYKDVFKGEDDKNKTSILTKDSKANSFTSF